MTSGFLNMFYILTAITFFAIGFYSGIKNAKSEKVEKAKSLIDHLKGR